MFGVWDLGLRECVGERGGEVVEGGSRESGEPGFRGRGWVVVLESGGLVGLSGLG